MQLAENMNNYIDISDQTVLKKTIDIDFISNTFDDHKDVHNSKKSYGIIPDR